MEKGMRPAAESHQYLLRERRNLFEGTFERRDQCRDRHFGVGTNIPDRADGFPLDFPIARRQASGQRVDSDLVLGDVPKERCGANSNQLALVIERCTKERRGPASESAQSTGSGLVFIA